MPRKSNSRTAAGAGSIRQRADGRWEGRYTIPADFTGKVERRSIYADTQKECRQQLAKIVSAIDNGTFILPQKITVENWLDTWMIDFVSRSVKPLTVDAYKAMIKNHIVPQIGSLQMQSVRGVHVQKLYNKMTDSGLSAKTVKNASAILHKSFDVAIKQGLLSVNPCNAAELPKVTRKEISPLSDAEIPMFLRAINGHQYENAYAVCLFAGLRENECLGMSWDQVDFDKGTLTISQQLQKRKEKGAQYYISPSTKSGKPRTISPPPIAFEYLKAEKTKQLRNRLCAGEAWSNEHNLVFTNADGHNIIPQTFHRHFKEIAKSIGRPDARPHDLRHTAATIAIASGADIKSVQSLMGHATATFTLDVYAHATERMREDTSSRMQKYFDNLDLKKA